MPRCCCRWARWARSSTGAAASSTFVFAAVLAVGLLLGAYLGARLGISLPVEVVQRGFGVLLVIVGVRFVFFS